eukprot:gene14883-22748_t
MVEKHAELGDVATGRRIGRDHLEQATGRQVADVLVQHHHWLRAVEAGGVEDGIDG